MRNIKEHASAICAIFEIPAQISQMLTERCQPLPELHLKNLAETSLDSYLASQTTGCIVALLADARQDLLSLPSRLQKQQSALKVVFLVSSAKVETVVKGARSGAEAIVVWPDEAEDVSQVLMRACQASRQTYTEQMQQRTAQSTLATLTLGERQVIELMMAGLSNKAIAAKLDIAIRTVEARRKQIFTKLDTRSIAAIFELLLAANPNWTLHQSAAQTSPAKPHFLSFLAPSPVIPTGAAI